MKSNIIHIKNKKGALLTLGVFLILLLLLSSSLLIYRSSLNSVKRVSVIENLDRMANTYSSIEKSIKEIFEQASGISVNYTETETGVTIAEDIPNNKSYDFNLSMLDFKAFVEVNFPEVYIDPVFLNNLPLIIRPENITYTHTDGYGHQRVQIIPQAITFNSYTVDIYNNKENVTQVFWESFTPGTFSFRVIAHDFNGNYFDTEELVDPTKTVNVHVYFLSGKEVKVKILPNTLAMLEIENKADEAVTSTFSIGFNYTRVISDVTLSDKLINVSYPLLGTDKVGTVKII